jgi:uncharacterized membrane protein YoaK (UPF0700 family)
MTSSSESKLAALVSPSRNSPTPVPSIDDSLGLKLLPFVLAFVAGSVDVIGFLGLDELFTAHITGNLVVLAAHLVTGSNASLALIISVPVFIVALFATQFLAGGLARLGFSPLRPLLLLQLALLCGFLAICFVVDPSVSAQSPAMLLAGMLGVSAMAVQNAMVRIAIAGSPSTAVLTTNITLLATDIGEIILGGEAAAVAKARERAMRTWPAVLGFLLGCAIGAWCEAKVGLRALVLPAGFALFALALGMTAQPRNGSSGTDDARSA